MTLGLLVAGVLTLMLCRVPVAIAFLLPSLIYLIVTPGLTIAVALQQITSGLDSFVLLAVPLFILAGNIMNVSGITDRIFDFVESIMGKTRGSLGYANVVGSVIFSGMSGSAVADAAGLGSVEIDAMRKRGYDARFSIGITAGSAVIGPIIPPSIPAVLYGVAASVSIGGLFVAGIIPGLVVSATLCIMVYFYAKRRNYPSGEQTSPRKIVQATLKAFPALMTPAIILGGILSGVFTPTEAAGVTVAYAAIISIGLYRALTLKSIYRLLVSTVETTATIMFIVGAAALFGWTLAREQAPQMVAESILSLTNNPVVFLLLVNLSLLLVGMLLDAVPTILILVPILAPLAEVFNINPLHFGIIVILNLMIGLVTPPLGTVLYVLSSVTKVPFSEVVLGTAPFLIPLFIALMLVTFIPSISLFLPQILGFLE